MVIRAPHPARICAAVLALACACQPAPVDTNPIQVTQAFIERMRGVHGDPVSGRKAVELLSKKARENLQERAKRATAAAGQQVDPEEMLVPSAFDLRFEPTGFSVETRGDYARVTVVGVDPRDVAEVHCFREDGVWRVVVDFPALPAIQMREG